MAARRVYTDEDRARVFVALTVNDGNVKRTARDVDVPVATVRMWKKDWENSPPDPEIMDSVATQVEQFVSDATRARDKALREWEAKVDAGEVGAKDLMVGVGILTDKINLAKGLATSRTESARPAIDPATIRELAAGAVQGALQAAIERQGEIEEAEWEPAEVHALPRSTNQEG